MQIIAALFGAQFTLLLACAVAFGVGATPAVLFTLAFDIIDLGIDWYIWRRFNYKVLSMAESVASSRAARVAIVIGAVVEGLVIISAPLIGMLLARFIAHS